MVKNKAIDEAAKELKLPYDRVMEVYSAFCKFIKQHLEALPIKGDFISREEYDNYRPSVSLSYLGRLHCSYDDIVAEKKRYEKNRSKKI